MGVRSRSETHDFDLTMKASAWRAVPDPGRTPVAAQAGSAGEFTPFASTPHVSPRPGWQTTEPRGCAGGRPRRGGTPVCDETVTAGCPRNYPVVHHQQRGDHRIVAALLTGRARTQVREARRASRKAPTPSVVRHPARAILQRATRGPPARSDPDSTGTANGPVARISDRPTRGHPETAPTPPTRAHATTAELPSTSKACIAVARQLWTDVLLA